MSIVARIGDVLERRTSRRGALSRAAVAGAAFAVAPVRYLVRPGTAWAVLRPADCPAGSRCTDGYTAFCCEIEAGNNTCPPDTYIAGWWKCSSYRGGGLCHGEGARYYVDCNRIPGVRFPGGCQCALGECERRRVDCNHFRYGQCNTQIVGTTEVVCRLVLCHNPATVPGMNCNGTEMVDNRTCSHEADCLRGLAKQLPGGGGA
ncbi:MAG: twin-arginine translocation signal domain-containing protein [Solirubrobacterales bacterium]|nr:twin-arginine translocation signal domain-containing protein [Solirubrobacterales bacterium]